MELSCKGCMILFSIIGTFPNSLVRAAASQTDVVFLFLFLLQALSSFSPSPLTSSAPSTPPSGFFSSSSCHPEPGSEPGIASNSTRSFVNVINHFLYFVTVAPDKISFVHGEPLQ